MSESQKMYRIRVVMDAEEDVIRDIIIDEASTLRSLHELILEAFNLEAGEMASFYNSNENWDQGEEISLVDFGGSDKMLRLMEEVSVEDYLYFKGARMIYVYDLFNLWTFFVETIESLSSSQVIKGEAIVKIKGERPNSPPQKNMEGVNFGEDDPEFDSEDSYYEEDDWNDDEY